MGGKLSGLHRFRGWFARRRTVLIVELTSMTVLVIAAWLLVERYQAGATVARMLLNPVLWLLVLVVSGLGTAGSVALYAVGRRGTRAVFARFPQLQGQPWERLWSWFGQWGARVLILSGIPTLGAPLSTAAGAFGIQRGSFLRWVFVAKLLRNWVLLLLLEQSFQFVAGKA